MAIQGGNILGPLLQAIQQNKQRDFQQEQFAAQQKIEQQRVAAQDRAAGLAERKFESSDTAQGLRNQLVEQQLAAGKLSGRGQQEKFNTAVNELTPFARTLKNLSDKNKASAIEGEIARRQEANLPANPLLKEALQQAQSGNFVDLNKSIDEVLSFRQRPKGGRFIKVPTTGGTALVDSATGQTQRIIENATKEELDQLRIDAKKTEAKGSKDEKNSQRAAALETADRAIITAEELINHPGLESATGIGSVFATAPGSPAADFETALESFQSQVFLNQVEKMRGMGTLTEAEGKKIAAALGSLSLKQSDAQLKKNLQIISDIFKEGKKRTRIKYGMTDPNQQADGQMTTPSGVTFTVK